MTKAVWRGTVRLARAASAVVGLAVVLAVVLGVATSALAAVPGDPFKLGRTNTVDAASRLVGAVAGPMLKVANDGTGPALALEARTGKAPLTVNAAAGKATNLDADRLDGKDSAEFLATGGKARDADTLDGIDSSDFAPRAAEAWRPVDADYRGSGFYVSSTGQCGGAGRPNWMDQARFGNDWARTAYFKDQAGVVHLKGQVRDNSSCWAEYDDLGDHAIIFVLPAGYRPGERQAFATTSNHAFGEVLVRPDGAVVALRGSFSDFSLNGITFRATG